eukprot:TRINITY_DN69722_c0_g1_i1.p1 TRINITY_DN69722_c0_g1~~TRINITY_DN69722_c0_g1_i1.p1  ORF type:complete len:172 (+),score=0.31 TRINITY_DN69722_c0_g1_i1:62-517(+)
MADLAVALPLAYGGLFLMEIPAPPLMSLSAILILYVFLAFRMSLFRVSKQMNSARAASVHSVQLLTAEWGAMIGVLCLAAHFQFGHHGGPAALPLTGLVIARYIFVLRAFVPREFLVVVSAPAMLVTYVLFTYTVLVTLPHPLLLSKLTLH